MIEKPRKGRKPQYSPELIEKAKKMRRDGYSYSVIVAELGFTSKYSVYYYTNPKRQKALQLAIRKYYVKNREHLISKMKEYYSKKHHENR